MKRWFWLLGLIVLCQAVGLAGAIFTVESVNTWYAEIVKPSFNPPSWIFGPVWTLLYVMMAVACWKIVMTERSELRTRALIFFGVQLFLNGIWSPLFFGLRNPGLALIDILLLWVAIGLTFKAFLKLSRPAGLLLLPYWAWVTFATVLNFSIWRLN